MRSSSRIVPAIALLACATVLGIALPSPADAHHSFSAVFEMNAFKEIEGKVTKVLWVNPHVKVYVATAEGEWEVEAGPVNLLVRMRIEKNTLKVGETIRAYGNPGKRNARVLWVSNIQQVASKIELLAAPGVKPRWPDTTPKGNPDVVLTAGVPVTDKKVTFFRIWATPIPEFPKPRGAAVLTAAGQKAQARYGIDKKVVADCEVPGMPFAMMSPYPMAIEQKGDQLLIRGEAYDLRRMVYLKAPATPPAPSPLGLSVGRINGNELTIETSRINYHSFGDLGPAQSNQSHVVERFKLSADGLKLDYDITVTDPVMLAKPWSWGGAFYAWQNTVIRDWSCGKDRS